MALDSGKRTKILASARRWAGTPYDEGHGDPSWRDVRSTPSALDCSTFVCRVAIDALGCAPELLAPNAGWLLDNLVEVDTPALGDLVGYGRAADPAEYLSGHEVIWHVMMYLGIGHVIGACDIAREVTTRPIEYEPELGARQWKLVDEPAFRTLELRPKSAPSTVASIALKKRRA